ncbi:Aldo/keto reductase [Calocera viscosa TUFC12733]|uniref:Aldo/keto reductase n=1 Tax=Calocera viscosa (strain TUFC12733) TaxID=1330018 RepID=A0A167MR90_CALVF|nr:Aldo/keto reductase [Calocera viscosa TUFC12733]
MSSQPQVEYRRVGKSGLRVSVPILGAMSFGSDKWAPWVINEDKALPLLKAAWDRGINTWDTANVYSNGESERVIAKAIKTYNIPRSKLVILTKCFSLTHDDPSVLAMFHPELPNSRDYVNTSGLSRQAIFQQVEASLKRLGTDYIDLLQIHRCDMDTPFEETMRALDDLVRSGKVRYIGASSMWAWQFAEYQNAAEKNGWTKFISMQNHYSLLYREEEREMNKYCDYSGVGLIPWGPLAAGQLARPLGETSVREDSAKGSPFEMKKLDADKEIINRVEKLAKQKGWSMGQVAQAWINTKVSSPIIGFSSVKRLEEAIIPDKKLTEEDIKYLEEPYVPKAIQGHF